MYGKYVLKRIVYGILMYIIMIFTFSVIFNSVAETTMRSQIDEQVAQQMRSFKGLSQEQLTAMRDTLTKQKRLQYHLDEPFISRIFWRAINTMTFQYGNSSAIKADNGDRDVFSIVTSHLPNTIVLFTTEIVIITILGTILGLYTARKPNGILDRFNSIVSMVTAGLPGWWLGMLFLMFFAYTLHIFPTGKMHSFPLPTGFMGIIDFLWHLALPLLTLLLLSTWGTGFISRNIVLANLQEDFVMAARARGIPEGKVLFGHTLRTSMPAIMTLAILGLVGSIGGNLLVEGIFDWPGIGNLYWIAVQMADVPVLIAVLAMETLMNLVALIILDVIYGLLDPRIKTGGGTA